MASAPGLTNLSWENGVPTLYIIQGTKISVNLKNYVYDVDGNPITITLNSSSLPSGLTYSSGIISGTTTSTTSGSLKITLKDSSGLTNTQTITVKTVNPSLVRENAYDDDINIITGATANFTKPTASNSVTFFQAYEGEFEQITVNGINGTSNLFEKGNITPIDSEKFTLSDKVGSDGILDTITSSWGTERLTYGTAKAVTSINGVATTGLYKIDVTATVITPKTVATSTDWWESWYTYNNQSITSLVTLEKMLLTEPGSTVWMEGNKEVKLLAGGNVVSIVKDGAVNTWNGDYEYHYAPSSTIIGKWTNKDGYLTVTLNSGEITAFKITNGVLMTTELPAVGQTETMEWYYGVSLSTFSNMYTKISNVSQVTIKEDSSEILGASDFYFSSEEISYNSNVKIKITQLETDGSLKLNGVDVTLGQVITSTDIKAGKLKFTPSLNEFGTNYANFKFKVSEDGGSTYSSYVYTKIFDVTNVADVRSSSSSYTLIAPDVVLNLIGTSAINGTGNALNNTITGNSAVNTLNGLAGNDVLNGGVGADTMLGGAGNDTYDVDNALDKVYETTTISATTTDAGGIDSVNSSVSYTLTSFVENLTLTGIVALNGIGNSLNNTITGNTLNNTLKGGVGNDTLIGALGNDTIYGETGNDILNGGLGLDILYGGTGTDKFVFNTTLNSATNKDTIKDFSVIDDTIVLENAIFTKLGTLGTLNTVNFVSNTTGKAVDTNDYLVYNKGTGQLFYDADGSGLGASVQIATLNTNLYLTNTDFTVI